MEKRGESSRAESSLLLSPRVLDCSAALSRRYIVFVNHPGDVELEVGREKMSRVGIRVEDEEVEVFVIYGPTPKEVRQGVLHAAE